MKRIAYFLPSVAAGGVARMTLNLVEESARRGLTTDLVLCRDAGAFRDQVPAAARVVVLPRSSQLRARRMALAAAPACRRELLRPVLLPLRGAHAIAHLPALVSYLERDRPDLLVAAKTHTNLTAIWGRALARASTRVAVSERTNLSREIASPKGRKWRWRHIAPVVRAVYPQADLIFAVSHGVADDLAARTGLPRRRIETVYNPVVTEALRRRTREPISHPWFREGEPPVVLGVGRLDPQKDFATLIRAFSRVREQRPARLLILGEGRERGRLLALAREIGVAADLALPGFVPNPTAYMARAGVFVLSSSYEGLPGALIEALHAGCPVVSTDCPSGPGEILEAGKYGPLVRVGDAVGLAGSILQRLAEPRGSDLLRARAEAFHVSASLDQLLEKSFRSAPA